MRIAFARILIAFAVGGCMAGCASEPEPSYIKRLANAWTPPTPEEVAAADVAGVTKVSDRVIPGDRALIWKALVTTTRQGLGLASLDEESGVVVYFPAIGARRDDFSAWGTDSYSPLLLQCAVAVALVTNDGQSKLHFAWVSPETGRPSSIGEPRRLRTAQELEVFQFVQDARVQCKDGVLRLLHGADDLASRFRGNPPPTPRGLRAIWVDTPTPPARTRLALGFGAWQSAETIRMNVVLQDEALTNALHAVLAPLQAAAGRTGDGTRIVVIESPEWQAFTVGNGDIFLSTAALTSLSGPEELAGLLAHEYSHLLHEDPAERVYRADRRRKQQFFIGVTVYAVGIIGGTILGLEIADENPSALFATDGKGLPGALAGGALGGMLAGAVFGAWAGTDVGNAIYHSYAQELELIADRNASELLWLAGYPPGAWLEQLERRLAADERAGSAIGARR